MSGPKRLQVWKSIFLQRTPSILLGVWGFFGAATTIRDNFFSPTYQKRFATPAILAQLTWTHYFMFFMVIALVAILEGAFTFFQKQEDLLARSHGTERASLEQQVKEAEDKLYQLGRQLQMPDIMPELLGMEIGENSVDGGSDSVLDTWVRVNLRLSNLNRVSATIIKIEFIILCEPSIRMKTREKVWMETFKEPVAFGTPQTGLVVFYAPNTLQSSILRWPFVIEVTDGTGNVKMTPQARFKEATARVLPV